MDFQTAAKLASYLAKDYAEDLFGLLASYRDISASEAASRLDLHIRTAQDFLETMASLDILTRQEVHEKKRPYFRYSLKAQRIVIDVDLTQIKGKQPEGELTRRIRERKDSGARFTTARSNDAISSVAIWTGDGRERRERRINLTAAQGRFLYHLPFPNGEPMSISQITQKAGVDDAHLPEILDVIGLLERYDVIEAQ